MIINGDDVNTRKAAQGVEGKEIITFGFEPGNDYTAANIANSVGIQIEFDLLYKNKFLTHITANVPGKHNILNAMAAAAAAIHAGATPEQVAEGLKSFGGSRTPF